MNIQIRKQAIRQSIIAAREKLAPAERLRASRVIVSALCGLAAYRQAQTVLGYLNFGAELDSEQWVRRALEDGKQVVLPRVNKASAHLDLYCVRDVDLDVAPGAWGIREPLEARCEKFVASGLLEFVLMPGVAFTRTGERLGYGGGYYDRLLANMRHRPVLVAGAFAMQVMDEIPQEATDHKVDWLVTETETIGCNEGKG